ncbi:hypothetical protein ACH3XW_34310 [Acanthocheilonema viteae]
MQKTNKSAISEIRSQTLLKEIDQRQHIRELFLSNLQQNNLTNDSSSSLSSLPSTEQYQNNKLLTEIRDGVQLRHVIPNAHKQCIKMLYDKTCQKLFTAEKDNINEKEIELETEKPTDIGNILLNAMRKRRLLTKFESSSTSDEDGNELKLKQWSDSDDNDDNGNDNGDDE